MKGLDLFVSVDERMMLFIHKITSTIRMMYENSLGILPFSRDFTYNNEENRYLLRSLSVKTSIHNSRLAS